MVSALSFVVSAIALGLDGQVTAPTSRESATGVVEQLRGEAGAAYENSDWKTAENKYSKITAGTQATATDYFRLGRSRIELGDYSRAIKPLDVAITATYHREECEFALSRAYAGLDLVETAFNHLDEAVKYGFEDISQVKKAGEFDSLRTHKRYIVAAEMVEFPAVKYKNGKLLDFMLGFWNYMMPGGAQGGFSVIKKLNKGYEIQEFWTSIDGTKSTTTYSFDKIKGTWNSTSVTTEGWKSERIVSKVADGVRIQGITNFPDGTSQYVREEWKKKSDTEMEHVIFHSYDEGQSWEEIVHGRFTIAIEQAPPL
ncbi:MAG: hypothetical protein KF824_02280 [Fimbriimonadaceae bacterium]|nr:MAG: hypothetical protein KF824_02280 [Fimbriimonadaceae bacterium]